MGGAARPVGRSEDALSCTNMMRCCKLDKNGNAKFLAHPDLLSSAFALQTSETPTFAKHGQRSEHVASCTLSLGCVLHCACFTKQEKGFPGPINPKPHLQKEQ